MTVTAEAPETGGALAEQPALDPDALAAALADAAHAGGPSDPIARVPALSRWRDPHPWHGWAFTAAIGIIAFVLRVWNVGHPRGKVFDEVYYATEGQEIVRFGYEDNRGYMFVVHPPLGKWFIGLSSAFARNMHWSQEVGWRLGPAIAGTVAVVMLARVARRMFRSNFFGAIAGALLALEGMSLVLSRVALLDIFLQPFLIGAFAALVNDREQVRGRLADLLEAGVDLRDRAPSFGPRPWRVVAGVMLGLACGVKWSALSFFVLLVILSLVWDRFALRAAGVRHSWRWAVRKSWFYGIGSLVLVPIGSYLLVWTGWFAGNNGFNRHWADTHGSAATLHLFGMNVPWNWGFLPGAIRSLGDYTYKAYQFHEGLYSPHPFSSKPWGWLVLGRPVDFYYNTSAPCGAKQCSAELLLIGTPLLWWGFIPAVLWVIWHYVTTRDWRAGVVLLMGVAGWLVWFQDPKRTMFIFYMAPLIPFLILGMTLGLGAMLGPPGLPRRFGLRGRTLYPAEPEYETFDGEPVANADADADADSGDDDELRLPPTPLQVSLLNLRERAYDFADDRRRLWGTLGLTAYLALVLVDFVWMWPLFRAASIPTDIWSAHMWLPSWI